AQLRRARFRRLAQRLRDLDTGWRTQPARPRRARARASRHRSGAGLARAGFPRSEPGHSIRRGLGRMRSMEMQNRAVIVTGGASGIGRATALLLAREGASVFVGDIDEDGGQTTADMAGAQGRHLEFLKLDLQLPASIAAFADWAHKKVQRVDGLVNAAGWD